MVPESPAQRKRKKVIEITNVLKITFSGLDLQPLNG